MLKTFIAFALLSVAAPQAAFAETGEISVRVPYGDLNLATADGARMFERRIAKAVDAACPAVSTRQLYQAAAIKKCRVVALRSADAQRRQAFEAAHAGNVQVAAER